MAIPDNIIDQVRDRTDIVEVISGYIPLKKLGRNYKANCPFHHEKTPSFVVSPDKQIYHCFGCGAGGNVFSFLMKTENVEFPEAVETLAKKCGVVLPRSSVQRSETNEFNNQLYKVNELACSFFQNSLVNNPAAKEYLASRGVGDETIKKFKIGYAPESWDALINFFKAKGITGAILEKAGLVIANDRGSHYDRFRNRVVFPIIDLKDRVLGFGARVLDASLPKYLNSPETPIYSKGKNLYGLNFSKDDIKKEGHALIVEGYLDAIIPYQAGVKNIIATLGTALTTDQLKVLKRFSNTVIMVYDPDEAGEAASLRSLDLFISEDMNVYIAELSSGLDPDNYIRKFGTEEFLKIIKSSKNIFEYKLDKLAKRFNRNTSGGKAAIVAEMLPTVSRINNAVLRSEFIKKLAEKLSIDEESIRLEMKKVKPDYVQRHYTTGVVEAKKDSKAAELIVLALLLEGKEFIKQISSSLKLEEFKSTSVRDAVSAVFSLSKGSEDITPSRLITILGNSSEAATLISEASALLENIMDKEKALNDCVVRIKKDNIKDRLNDLQGAIKTAHSQKDEEKVKQLVTEYNYLVKDGKA